MKILRTPDKCFEKFIGMFSLVIYEKKSDKIFFISDRVGTKPLYYYIDKDIIIFSLGTSLL